MPIVTYTVYKFQPKLIKTTAAVFRKKSKTADSHHQGKKTLALQSCDGFYKTHKKLLILSLTYNFTEVPFTVAPLRIL